VSKPEIKSQGQSMRVPRSQPRPFLSAFLLSGEWSIVVVMQVGCSTLAPRHRTGLPCVGSSAASSRRLCVLAKSTRAARDCIGRGVGLRLAARYPSIPVGKPISRSNGSGFFGTGSHRRSKSMRLSPPSRQGQSAAAGPLTRLRRRRAESSGQALAHDHDLFPFAGTA